MNLWSPEPSKDSGASGRAGHDLRPTTGKFLKLEKEEEREREMMRRKVVIRFPIDPMSEALVEVNQTIKASAELVAKETAIERVPVVEEEAKVDKEDEGQTRELRANLLLSQAFSRKLSTPRPIC